MNQLLLGASAGFVIGAIWYAVQRGRVGLAWFIAVPLMMLAGAVWAVIPDIPRLLGMTELYVRWAQDPATNIFFWHYTIDLAETDSPWYAAGGLVMGAAMLGAAWYTLYRAEKDAVWPM